MDREIFYDSKNKSFYYRSINKNYISKETILKSFLGDNLKMNYPYVFDKSIGHIIDLNSETKIDYMVFKNIKLITSLKFGKSFDRVFQSFENPDLLNMPVNTICPENIYGIILVENKFSSAKIAKENSYFFWYDKNHQKVYKPNYNNLYDNCNICLGDNLNIEKAFSNLAEKVKILFEDNPTNNDLRDYETENFLSFEIRNDYLYHSPIYVKLRSVGIETNKRDYLNLIMGDFLK
jgi:hypothetical protein